jgi:glycine oxidase
LTHPDAVVVGAGAIGAACAYELAGAGLRVTVVERAEPGAEASGASAGILSVPSASRRDPLAVLARLSRDLYGSLAAALREEAGSDVGLGRTGHLHLCMMESEARHARRAAADPAERGDGTSYVEADELRRLEPAVSPAALGALHPPEELLGRQRAPRPRPRPGG